MPSFDLCDKMKVQLDKLERALAEVMEDYRMLTEPKATVQLFFTDLNEQVYTVCYPRLKSLGYTGTLVISAEQFPGEEGCMTEKQFEELMSEGWKICVAWPKEASGDSWWTSLKQKMSAMQMGQSQIVYFPEGSYQPELDSKIAQMGFTIVVNEVSGVESPLQEHYEEGLWHLGALGYMEAKSKVQLLDAIAKDANVIYLISFSIANQLYESTPFRGMLQIFQEYELSGDLIVSDAEEAREYHKSLLAGIAPDVEEDYKIAVQELTGEIQMLKEQLQEIDKKYQ